MGWHHRLNGREFRQTPGESAGQEAWRIEVHGITKVRHDLVTEQQQEISDIIESKY